MIESLRFRGMYHARVETRREVEIFREKIQAEGRQRSLYHAHAVNRLDNAYFEVNALTDEDVLDFWHDMGFSASRDVLTDEEAAQADRYRQANERKPGFGRIIGGYIAYLQRLGKPVIDLYQLAGPDLASPGGSRWFGDDQVLAVQPARNPFQPQPEQAAEDRVVSVTTRRPD